MHTICWSTPRWTFKGTRENSLCSSGVFFSNSLGVSTELAGKEKESHVMTVYMAVADLSLPPIIPTALGWCYGVCGRGDKLHNEMQDTFGGQQSPVG